MFCFSALDFCRLVILFSDRMRSESGTCEPPGASRRLRQVSGVRWPELVPWSQAIDGFDNPADPQSSLTMIKRCNRHAIGGFERKSRKFELYRRKREQRWSRPMGNCASREDACSILVRRTRFERIANFGGVTMSRRLRGETPNSLQTVSFLRRGSLAR